MASHLPQQPSGFGLARGSVTGNSRNGRAGQGFLDRSGHTRSTVRNMPGPHSLSIVSSPALDKGLRIRSRLRHGAILYKTAEC